MNPAYIDPPELEFTQREIDDAKREIAQEQWDDKSDEAQEWLCDTASQYIVDLVRGGDYYNATLRNMERDCVADMASYVPTWMAIRRLRG